MDMSCPHQQWGRRRAPAAAGGLVTGPFPLLVGASCGAAGSGLTQGSAVAAGAEYTNPGFELSTP
jgi:hypothetical protein